MTKKVSKKKNEPKSKKIPAKPAKTQKKIKKINKIESRKKPAPSPQAKHKIIPISKKIRKTKKIQQKAKPKHGLKELQSLKPKQSKEKKEKELFIKCVNCGRQHKLFPGDEYLLRRQKYFVCRQLTQMDCVNDESLKKSVQKDLKKQTKLNIKSKIIKKDKKKDKKIDKKIKEQKKKSSLLSIITVKKEPIYSWIQCEACDKWFQLYDEQKFLLKYEKFYCHDLCGIHCAEYLKKFPQKKFKSEEAELKYLLKTSQFDKMKVDQWIQCNKCDKWRLLSSEKEFTKLSNKKGVTCQILGTNCRKKEDKVNETFISIKK